MLSLRSFVITLLLAATSAGCGGMRSEWAFRNIALHTASIETTAAALPSGAERTTVGFASYESMRWPDAESAIVVLRGEEGTVSDKLRIELTVPRLGSSALRRVVLEAEIAGTPAAGDPPGPVARLGHVLRGLGPTQGKPQADRAHALVAAGLVRILEALAGATVPQSAYQRLGEVLMRVPPNGSVTITNATPHTYGIHYTATDTVR